MKKFQSDVKEHQDNVTVDNYEVCHGSEDLKAVVTLHFYRYDDCAAYCALLEADHITYSYRVVGERQYSALGTIFSKLNKKKSHL